MLKNLKSRITTVVASLLLAAGAALVGPTAGATTILTFGQSVGGSPVVFTAGVGSTTITMANIPVIVSFILSGGTPSAFLSLAAASTGPATVSAGFLDQHFSGSFCISSAITCGGTKYLYGSFVDDFHGALGGSSATLSASTPPFTNVTFASDTIALASLGIERAMGLSFADFFPTVTLCPIGGNTLCSATSSVSGVFSANNNQRVPEPATLGLLGIALAGLGFSRRRKQT